MLKGRRVPVYLTSEAQVLISIDNLGSLNVPTKLAEMMLCLLSRQYQSTYRRIAYRVILDEYINLRKVKQEITQDAEGEGNRVVPR